MKQENPFLDCIAIVAAEPNDLERLRKITEFVRAMDAAIAERAEKKGAENENT